MGALIVNYDYAGKHPTLCDALEQQNVTYSDLYVQVSCNALDYCSDWLIVCYKTPMQHQKLSRMH